MKELIEAACAAIGWSRETYVHMHTNIRPCRYVHNDMNNKSAACRDMPTHRQPCVSVVHSDVDTFTVTVLCVYIRTYHCCTGVKSTEEFAFVTEEDLSKRRRVRTTIDVYCSFPPFQLSQL